jgi:uncharacterized protein (DUF2236 family)
MAKGTTYVVSEPALESLLDEVRTSAAGSAWGIFGPASISWKVNRESALFLAAGRATLLQLAHPWVAAAISEHSTALGDPIGRVHQTFRVMFTMAFGSVEQALAASRRLQRRHSSIRGELPEAVGRFAEGSSYEANEIAALRWVYATLVDSALVAYELVLPPLNDAEREQCYQESKTMAALFGIPRDHMPSHWPEFKADFDSTCESSLLAISPNTRDMAHQLQRGAGSWLRPPFWYRALTTHLLPPHLREAFQFPYREREERAATRAMQWLPKIYRRLPDSVRFVGPYQEAQARLIGKPRPGLTVRLSNRLWVGEATLLSSGGRQENSRRPTRAFRDKIAP